MKQVGLKTWTQVPWLCRYNLFSWKILIYGAAASAAPFDPLWQLLPFVSADPSPVTRQMSSRTLCQPFSLLLCYHSSLPALLLTASSHTHLTSQIGGDKKNIRISGYYSSVPPGQPSSYVSLIVHLCGSIAKHRWMKTLRWDRKGDTLKYKTLLPHSGPTKNSTWLKSLQVYTCKLGKEVE